MSQSHIVNSQLYVADFDQNTAAAHTVVANATYGAVSLHAYQLSANGTVTVTIKSGAAIIAQYFMQAGSNVETTFSEYGLRGTSGSGDLTVTLSAAVQVIGSFTFSSCAGNRWSLV